MVASMRRRLWFSVVSVFMAAVVLAGCGAQNPPAATQPSGSQPAAPAKPKDPIKLADVQWQSLWINNAITGFILQHGYGYPVETVEMTTPIMQQALVKGDVDMTTELWRANIIDWYNESLSAKKIMDLGPMFEKATQGWYVPRYVIEGDPKRNLKPLAPDLKTVQDLKKYKHLFKDPENPTKGILINCITGWQCAKINRIKLQAYGLDKDYNVMEPGASAALDAAIAGAYKRGESFLAYYWEPTWLAGTYDLVQLEEPAWSKECENEQQKALKEKTESFTVGAQAGCGYPVEEVTKAINPKLAERAPEVVGFLQKMVVGTDPLNKTAAYMEANKAKAEQAAIWFFENYQDRWREWLDAEVEKKVEEALKAAGAKL